MEDCPICCEEDVKLWGVWECSHSVCWKCALRVRAANTCKDGSVNKDTCIMCKALSTHVYVTRDPDVLQKKPAALKAYVPAKGWDHLLCDSAGTAAKVTALRELRCTKCNAYSGGGDVRALNAHYKEAHGVAMCAVCVANRQQVFASEHTLYTVPEGLAQHESLEEDCPADDANFLGHPQCKFCNTPQYDNAALFQHCTSEHYTCELCDPHTEETHICVYKDRAGLAAHLRKVHVHYCEDCHATGGASTHPCAFTFPSAMDLQLHASRVHKTKKGGSARVDPSKLASPTRRETPAALAAAAAAAASAGAPSADGEKPPFALHFCSKNKAEVYVMREDKKGRKAPPKGVDEAATASTVAGRGRGRGRGGAAAAAATAAPVRIVAKERSYDVEFASDEMHIGFCRNDGGLPGLRVYVQRAGGSLVTHIVYEEKKNGEGRLTFPELKKRLSLPRSRDRKRDDGRLRALCDLASECGVEHNLEEAGKAEKQEASQPPPCAPARPEQAKRALSAVTEEIQEELDTLAAIYGEDSIVREDPNVNVWTHRVEAETQDGRPAAVLLHFAYPVGYSDVPPEVDFATDSSCGVASSYAVLPIHMRNGLVDAVLSEWCPGEPVIYSCIEWAVENFAEQLACHVAPKLPQAASFGSGSGGGDDGGGDAGGEDDHAPELGIEVAEGPALSDRKSKFVARIAKVTSEEQARSVVRYLRGIKRVMVAAHPTIYAYRIEDGARVREGRDDDGESGAADKLLFFLQRANVQNYVVVVTRYYGGIHLGPDRFKHILTVAKELLQEHGVIPPPVPPKGSKK